MKIIRTFLVCGLLLAAAMLSGLSQNLPPATGKRSLTAERAVDELVLSNLLQHASDVVVGQITAQNYAADRYGLALSTNTPFRVKVTAVLVGQLPKDKEITVGVRRDEVNFRYPKDQPMIFFLKKTVPPPTQTRNPDPILGPGEYRAVADYFGVLPYSFPMERIIVGLKAEMSPKGGSVP